MNEAIKELIKALRIILDAFGKREKPVYAPVDIPSPSDIISEDNARAIVKFIAKQLGLPEKEVIIATIANSKSMDGLMDYGHNPILTSNMTYIRSAQVGDVIVWSDPNYSSGKIIHQVIDMGSDLRGGYYKTKGIHNELPDLWTIRLGMIEYIALGILW